MEELFEIDGQRSEALRFGRGVPLAPDMDAVIERQSLDDDADVGGETASRLVCTKDGVVVIDEFQLYYRGELLGVMRIEPVPARSKADGPLDHGEVRRQ